MALIYDFSNIADSTFDFSIKILCKNSFLKFESNNFNYYKPTSVVTFEEIYFFWNEFGLGLEYLLKAVLFKHQISFIKCNTAIKQKEVKWWGAEISSNENAWLDSELKLNGITHTKMFDTDTLANAIKKIDKLQNEEFLSFEDCQCLKLNLSHFRVYRRNQLAHTFTKSISLVDNDDLTTMYLPAVNLLIAVFRK